MTINGYDSLYFSATVESSKLFETAFATSDEEFFSFKVWVSIALLVILNEIAYKYFIVNSSSYVC